MIEFNYETDFFLNNPKRYINWIKSAIDLYDREIGEINYYFYNDEDLHKINLEHLQHDDYTDVISFDYSVGNIISGDICISTERVTENAKTYQIDFETELARVMCHGVLHFLGFKDKIDKDNKEMIKNEDVLLNLLKNK